MAGRAVNDHTTLARKTMFIDAANDDWLGVPSLFEALRNDDDAMSEVRRAVRDARQSKTSFTQVIELDGKRTVNILVFYPEQHTLFDPADRDIDAVATIDHEIGHLLAPSFQDTLGENAADAYAVARHLQRHQGTQSNIDYAAWKRTMTFMLGGQTSHLTTFTIDRIIADRNSAKILSLSPHQTAALARAYARKHTPGKARLESLSAAFAAARGTQVTQRTFREIAKVTLAADPHSDTFYLGMRALMPLLSGAPRQLDGKTICLHGDQWRGLRRQLEHKCASLTARHPLRLSAP